MTQASLIQTEHFTVPQIQATKNYDQFRLMGGNRQIDYNHVKQLKREIEANPDYLPSNPISVNEHMFIIDGQHRHMACRELEMPVYYIMTQGLNLKATRHLNTTQRPWTLLDFARSFAAGGMKEYQTFLAFHTEFPKIAPAILRLYLAGGPRHDMSNDFKRGEFQIDDVEVARKNLERLNAVIKKTKVHMNVPMASALLSLALHNDEFNWDKFITKLDRDNVREAFSIQTTLKGCMRSIEDAYSFQSKYPIRLY